MTGCPKHPTEGGLAKHIDLVAPYSGHGTQTFSAMSHLPLLLLLLCVASFAAHHAVSLPPPSPKPTAYEVLQSYGFPVGLLPKGVLGYDLDASTGRFSAYLDGTCGFSIESYQLRYRPTITGVISDGRLSDLQGVNVKILFFWVNIIEVDLRGNRLEFSVGILSADFPVDSFYECLQCGCGLNCGGVPGRRGGPSDWTHMLTE